MEIAKEKKNKEYQVVLQDKGRCPLIDEALPHCYCSDTRSMAIDDIIYYCGGNYEQCPIYQNNRDLL
ncbi:MAG: hypothetical protein IMF07_06595 [Proteobacteria bacterium]|nr:hypothetical protein [Pseudomonadota bacterium]